MPVDGSFTGICCARFFHSPQAFGLPDIFTVFLSLPSKT